FFAHTTDKAGEFKMPTIPIESYAHRYISGEVDCLCVFGENLIAHDTAAQFFLVYAVTYGSGMQPASACVTIIPRYCLPVGPRTYW
ncbi:MAG TPA: hypothetical protein VIW22_01110, partial [Nitrososphaerales archaeon]